ncbi:MAG: efflux RND transporter permease subunit [Nitratireductor sp.]|nr:efflux RND transporter permease subunit [Nitratireductor sp.]
MTGALETILSRPKTVITMMIVMVIAGILSYISVPKEANPDIDVPVYYVSIGQRGVSPEDAERLLVKPMETELRGLDGLKEITGVASEGHAGIVLEFEIGTNKDKVLADIRDKVDLAKASLPSEADEPAIFETNFALQPTIIVTLSGDVPERTLYNLARQLKDEIEAVSTVREAKLKGARVEQLEVVLDLLKLESYDITQEELLNALAQYNQLVPAGFIDDGAARFNVKLPGLVETAQDVYSIPIKQSGEGVVTLGEVADIRRNFKDASTYTRVNGQPAMSLEVVKRIGTNIIENNTNVREVVDAFTKNWPQTIKINYMIDQSSFIFEVLGSLQSSILTAISLVMIVVIGSLGLRSGLLVGLAIPTSFMVGFLILAFLGMTVNMMVMFGLVLTVGMLVDGAIVMIEYADRKMAEGLPPDEAYNRAAKLMFWPIVSSTATTLAAFLPLLLWPGVSGEFMSYLPVMVIIVLTASLLTALVFVPTTGRVFAHFGEFMSRITGRERRDRATDAGKMLSAQAELEPEKLRGVMGVYVRTLNALSGTLLANVIVITAVIALTVGTFVTFGANSKGVEFFVDEEPDIATLFVQARGNLSGQDIRDIGIEVEHEVLQVAGIDNIVMTATAPGGGGGGGGVDLAAPQDMPADVLIVMQIELADYSERRKAAEIFDEIRQRTADIGGIKVEIRKLEGGPPTGKDVRLQITSNNYDLLTEQVGRVRTFFDTQQDLQDVEDSRPLPGIEWEIEVDREEAGRYNAGIAAVGSMVQLVTNGVEIGKYRPDDSEDEVDIIVRLPEEERSLDKLSELKLRTPNGQVPISNFIEMTPQQKVSSITRRDGFYAMDVKANLEKGAQFGDRDMVPDDKVKQIQTWLDSQEWPADLRFRFRGADEDQKEAGAFLGKAAAGALFLMFIILVTQFNSFYQTFLTLSTVILAIVGVLIGMLITGQKFSIIMTGTGVVALAGIVVNNAIVLIDTFNRLRSEGVDVHQAVLKTSAQRFRPIFLTTFTTILGLIPMALTVNFDYINQVITYGSITSIWWVQLSTAVISGLAFSTMLTLVLIPVMLSLPTNIAEKFGGRRKVATCGEAPMEAANDEPVGKSKKTGKKDGEVAFRDAAE